MTENNIELNYSQFDKLVNLKDTDIRRVKQPCFYQPEYENGHIRKSSHESKSMIVEGITSDYTINDIMAGWFDPVVRDLFFRDIKKKLIEMELTHFYSLTFKDGVCLDDGRAVTRIVVRGVCDDYTKLLNKRLIIQENLEEILLDEDKPKQE